MLEKQYLTALKLAPNQQSLISKQRKTIDSETAFSSFEMRLYTPKDTIAHLETLRLGIRESDVTALTKRKIEEAAEQISGSEGVSLDVIRARNYLLDAVRDGYVGKMLGSLDDRNYVGGLRTLGEE